MRVGLTHRPLYARHLSTPPNTCRENCEKRKHGGSCFHLGVQYFVGAGVKQDFGEGYVGWFAFSGWDDGMGTCHRIRRMLCR